MSWMHRIMPLALVGFMVVGLGPSVQASERDTQEALYRLRQAREALQRDPSAANALRDTDNIIRQLETSPRSNAYNNDPYGSDPYNNASYRNASYDSRSSSYGGNRNEEEINRMYQEILGRNVDQQGLNTYTNMLYSGASLSQIRGQIANSPEARNALNTTYRQVLCRDVDAAGLRTYTDALSSGATMSQIRNTLANSPEAKNRRCY